MNVNALYHSRNEKFDGSNLLDMPLSKNQINDSFIIRFSLKVPASAHMHHAL